MFALHHRIALPSLQPAVAGYLRRARELGRALGDSPELSQLCREAYQEYRRGGISSAAYNAIYTVCLEYAQPR